MPSPHSWIPGDIASPLAAEMALRRLRIAASVLMLGSGFAGLGYQIAWTRQSAAWLGHEAAATLAIVAAFFGGIGAGAWVLGGRIDATRAPARWYALCEALIGVWGLMLALIMEPASR